MLFTPKRAVFWGCISEIGCILSNACNTIRNHEKETFMKTEKNINKTDSRLLTYKEVSEISGLSTSTLRRWVKEGAFPAPIVPANNKAVRFKASDVYSWLNDR